MGQLARSNMQCTDMDACGFGIQYIVCVLILTDAIRIVWRCEDIRNFQSSFNLVKCKCVLFRSADDGALPREPTDFCTEVERRLQEATNSGNTSAAPQRRSRQYLKSPYLLFARDPLVARLRPKTNPRTVSRKPSVSETIHMHSDR